MSRLTEGRTPAQPKPHNGPGVNNVQHSSWNVHSPTLSELCQLRRVLPVGERTAAPLAPTYSHPALPLSCASMARMGSPLAEPHRKSGPSTHSRT